MENHQTTPFQHAWAGYKKSINEIKRININLLFAAVYETLFILLFWALWIGFEAVIALQRQGFSKIPLDREVMAQQPALIEAASEGLTGFLAGIGLSIAVFGLLFALLYCTINGMIWARLNNQVPTITLMKRWIKTTYPTAIVWLAVFVATAVLFKPTWYFITVPAWYFAALYSMTCLHLTLASSPATFGWKAIKDSFRLGVCNLGILIWPIALWLATYIPITFLLGLVFDMTRTEALVPYLIVMTVWLRHFLLISIHTHTRWRKEQPI